MCLPLEGRMVRLFNIRTFAHIINSQKYTDFPLLNWLTDTCSRYRINGHYTSKKDITTADWRKSYAFLTKMEKSNKRVCEKLDSAVKSFFKRMFNSVRFNPVSLFDDSVNDYCEYFIALNEAIESLGLCLCLCFLLKN